MLPDSEIVGLKQKQQILNKHLVKLISSLWASTIMGWVLLQGVRLLAAGDRQAWRRHHAEVMRNVLASVFVSTRSLLSDLTIISTLNGSTCKQKRASAPPGARSQAPAAGAQRWDVGTGSRLELLHPADFSPLSGILG